MVKEILESKSSEQEHLGIPEDTEPGPGEVELDYLDKLAEEEETFVDELVVKEGG